MSSVSPPSVILSGSGICLPKNAFSNEDIFRWHQRKSPQWMAETFGIQTRYAVFNYHTGQLGEEDDNDLAIGAAQRALLAAGLDIQDIDAILLSTATPAHVIAPDNACYIHHRLGARPDAPALVHIAGCAAIMNVMMLAASMIRSGQARHVLVTASNTMSAFLRNDLADKTWLQATIFGDAGAAFILSASETPNVGFSDFYMGTDHTRDVLYRRFGGTKHPATPDNLEAIRDDIYVFDYRRVPDNLRYVFHMLYARDHSSHDPLNWVLFNMSNAAIQRAWAHSVGLSDEQCVYNMERYGNCAAASLALVLHEWLTERKPTSGQTALMMVVGTGLQFGSVLYRVP